MRLRRFRKLSWLTCRGGGQGTYEYYSASETSTTYISPSSQVQNSYCLELVRISQITFTSTLLPNGHNKKAAIVGDLRLAIWRNKLMMKHSFEFVEFARFLHKKNVKKTRCVRRRLFVRGHHRAVLASQTFYRLVQVTPPKFSSPRIPLAIPI